MDHISWYVVAAFTLDLLIRSGLSIRVIMRRLPVCVALAWLLLILVFPFFGGVFYLLLGEYRLGYRRTRRAIAVRDEAAKTMTSRLRESAVDPDQLDEQCTELAHLGSSLFDAPLLSGNRMKLLSDAETAFPALISDIDQAKITCELEFYIWNVGGLADEVVAALKRAANRGVVCRVLVDAFGSAAFLKSELAKNLQASGVKLQAAIRSGPVSALFTRPDLRLHRKIAIIDRQVAYVGSLNMADPRFFKTKAGVGQWVDAMVRIEGPATTALGNIVLQDWAVEAKEKLALLSDPGWSAIAPPKGESQLQVFASGPLTHVYAIEQVLLMAIYMAEHELILTTPYFIPSESILLALLSAADRGVEVTLIVPAKIDSRLIHYGSRAHQIDLLSAGVRIALYGRGLLHTKSVTVDGKYSLFGSVNLDPRSLHLDFEVTLAIYDMEITSALRDLQLTYLGQSELLDLATCRSRSNMERFAENVARLAGPVL